MLLKDVLIRVSGYGVGDLKLNYEFILLRNAPGDRPVDFLNAE